MKIECTKEKLLEAVQKTEKVTGKNLSLPILSCISFETENSQLKVKATNLDIGIELSIPVKVLSPGSAAIPGSLLLQFLSNIPQSEKITIESVDGNVTLTTNHTHTVIKGQQHDEFPIIPRISVGTPIAIKSEVFVGGLRSVWYSAAVTSMKPELSSVYIYQEGIETLVFVATDSFRLAEKKIHTSKLKDFEPILIPFKNVSEIVHLLDGVKEEISVVTSANQIAFSWEGAYLVSRIIDGTFPDYKQIIPKESKTEATMLKQELMQSLKLAHVFADTFNQVTLRVAPSEKMFEIVTRNSDLGENHNNLESALTGEDVTISFNYKYIIDCFQSMNSDSVTLSFQGLGRPLIIRPVSDQSFMYLVMPMNK